MSLAQTITKAKGGDWHGHQGTIPTPGHSARDRGTAVKDMPGDNGDVLVHSFNGGDPLEMKRQWREEGLLPPLETAKPVKMKFGPQTGSPTPSPANESVTKAYKTKAEKPFEMASCWEFVTSDGVVTYRKLRHDLSDGTKRFSYEHKTANGWVSGRGNYPVQLYGLLEIMAAPDDAIVFMAEGERKADKLNAWGFPACSHKDLPENLESAFKGRAVAILPDNDETGTRLAEKAHKAVLADGAAHAFIVELPRLKAGEDIVDWDGNPAELIDLTNKAHQAVLDDKPLWQKGISARDLMAKTFEPIRYIIPGYVAEGLTVFAGAPKIGKSWMAMQFAVMVATGKVTFGDTAPDAGDVLYLALEDNERRLQKRLRIMALTEAPERLTFHTTWPDMDNGCADEVRAWLEAAKRPRMIIVDVLAKVRGQTRGKETSYDADYRLVSGLQKLAGEYGVAVVMVHHTRKMDSDDPFDAVSGTRGITGSADTVLVLKADRETGQTVLYGRGRDIEEIESCVRFEPDNGTWEVLGQAHEIEKTDERQEIINLLINSEKSLSIREISDNLSKKYDAVRKTLNRMYVDGRIEKKGRGQYAVRSVRLSGLSGDTGQSDT